MDSNCDLHIDFGFASTDSLSKIGFRPIVFLDSFPHFCSANSTVTNLLAPQDSSRAKQANYPNGLASIDLYSAKNFRRWCVSIFGWSIGMSVLLSSTHTNDEFSKCFASSVA